MLTEHFHICKQVTDSFKTAFEGTVYGRTEWIAVPSLQLIQFLQQMHLVAININHLLLLK